MFKHALSVVSLVIIGFLPACTGPSSNDTEAEEIRVPMSVTAGYYRDIVPNFCDWAHKPTSYRCVVDLYGHPLCRFDEQGYPVDFTNEYYVYTANNATNTIAYDNDAELYQPMLWCHTSPDHSQPDRIDFEERAGKTMLKIPGLYKYTKAAPIVVTGWMVSSYDRREQCGRFFVDLVTSDDGTNWTVDASTAFVPNLNGSDFKVEANVSPRKLFRVDIRAETDPKCAPRLQKFHIMVPACIPDQENPGQCL